MKKSLSVLLAVILLVSCVSVGLTGLSIASAEGVSCTVAASVLKQGDLNGGYIKGQNSATVTSGNFVTFEAVPYYGNSFAGWYDGDTLVSTNAKFDYTVTKNVELKAKFNIYNLIEDGNFATSAVGDTEPKATANVAFANTGTYKPTFAVENNSTYGKVLKYYSTASAANNVASRRDLGFPLSVKKNTKYVFRFSFQNNQPSYAGFAIKTAQAWASNATITYSMAVTKSGTDTFPNIHGWSYNYAANTTAISDNDMKRYANAVASGNSVSDWYDVEVIFDSLNNETLYFCIGILEGGYATTYLANMQFSELTEIPVDGGSKTVEAGSFTVKRDPYITEEYKMVSSAANSNGQNPNYFSTVYTLADKLIPTTATAVPATDCALEGWYDANNTLLGTSTVLNNFKAGDTPRFMKAYDNEAGGIISKTDTTVIAKPFYGNRFLGWYKDGNLVSSDEEINKSDYTGVVAKFTNDNWLIDGDFETGYDETANYYNSLPSYSAANRGTASVVNITDINKDALAIGEEYGKKALLLVPNQGNSAGKRKALLDIPVTLEAGKKYLFKFAYTSLAKGIHDGNKHALIFSAMKEYGDPDEPQMRIPWRYVGSNDHITYSFHSQPAAHYEENKSITILDGILVNGTSTASSSWGMSVDNTEYLYNKEVCVSNAWNEVYIVLNPKESGNFFITLGTWESNTDSMLFDNMSFTEVFDGTDLTTAVVSKEKNEKNGKILSYQADVAAFEATKSKGFAPIVTTPEKAGSIDPTKPLYAKMSYTFYADSNKGYEFEGWYLDDVKISSNEKLTVCGYDGKQYIAKFKHDPNKYTADVVVDDEGGIYGGYITSETEFEGLVRKKEITVSAVAYSGNEFLGWYNDDERVSKKATDTFEITKNTTLTAKFEINNLIADSGYENTTAGTAVMGNDWSSTKADAYGMVAADAHATGKKSVSIGSINHAFRYRDMTIEAGKTYHLGFNWTTSYASTESSPIGIDYVAVKDSVTGNTIKEYNPAELVAALGDTTWQKAFVNFESGASTSVYFEILYTGDIGLFYIDDIVLMDTATTPFIINADVEKVGNIFPGYVKVKKQTAAYGNSVTVTAIPYERNEFLGWYRDGIKVSDDATYSFAAEDFANFTAKMTSNNLVPDSGFENTPTNVSLSDLGSWKVDAAQKATWGFDVWAYNLEDTKIELSVDGNKSTLSAADGNVALRARHRSPTFHTTLTGLKENTYYIFSFQWIIDKQSNNGAAIQTVKLTGVQRNEELGAGRGVGIGSTSTTGWQTVTVPFFSGQNTEIDVELGYKVDGNTDACLFIDDMSLYASDYITIVQSKGGEIQTTFNGGESGPAEKGQEIVLNAIADPGHTFVGWYDYTDPTKCLGTNATYTFNADGALAITARWEGPNAEPINYFIDGDFENNCIIPPTFDHPNSSTDWCKYGITTQSGTLTAKSGKQFMTLSANSRYTNFLISHLEPATTYTVSFWYSGDASNEFTSIFVFERYGEYEHIDREHRSQEMNISPVRNYSKTDSYQYAVGSFMPNSIHHSGTWQRGEFTFTTTNRREVYFHIENGGSGQFYFDDLKIVKGNKGGYTDEIINGDFENAYTENGWCRIDNLGNVSTDVNTTNSFDESYALLLPGTTLVKGINLRETSAYTLSFKARTVSNSGALSFGITKGGTYDLTNAISGAAKSSVTLGSEWNTYTMTFTSQGWLQNNIVFTSGEGARIDDVTLTKATDLVNAGKVDFESAEQRVMGTVALAAINNYTNSNSYEHGTYGNGNYAGTGYNDSFYEIADIGYNSSHSLVMRKDPIKAITATTVKESWKDSNEKLHEGTYDLMSPSGYISHPLHQSWTRFKLRAGKTYTLTYYAKADKKTSFKSMMVAVQNDWFYKELTSEEITVGTDWTKVTQTFTMINSMVTRNNIAFFCINGLDDKTDSDIYFDNIEIKETASSIITEKETELYTQDISQNYFRNFSFEKSEGEFGKYSKAASDAVYGEKIGKFTKGDKLILPIKTRVDYNIEWASEYTFAASVRANSGAKGFVGLAYSPDGTNRLASIKTDKVVNLLSNTKGKWERKGYTFSDYRLGTLYLVIECTAGSFELDYLALFNDNHGYKDFQNDHSVTTFDPKDENNFVDMNTVGKGNYISGVLSGLPSGSKVILKGEKTYESAIDANGAWGFEKIAGGTYDMYIDASDANALTLWGDLTFSDEGVSGLACERLNGDVISIVGEGVRNGIVKIVDDDTEWAYLTATDADGQYNAYILDSNWYIAGTTNIEAALKESGVTTEQFN